MNPDNNRNIWGKYHNSSSYSGSEYHQKKNVLPRTVIVKNMKRSLRTVVCPAVMKSCINSLLCELRIDYLIEDG